mmetsp:Transcript_5477/g.15445  ORF Transcript_5477/g.15445 Transcript_5477/m.15445 type:complete len:99 (+) Transcript_5477:324-620(+)
MENPLPAMRRRSSGAVRSSKDGRSLSIVKKAVKNDASATIQEDAHNIQIWMRDAECKQKDEEDHWSCFATVAMTDFGERETLASFFGNEPHPSFMPES